MPSPLFDPEDDDADAPAWEGGVVGAYPAVRVSSDPVEPSRAVLMARQAGRRLWVEVQALLRAKC